jgi:predicted glycosyltransferase
MPEWKAPVPYLARRFRVITVEGRGNGRADRPVTAEAYSDREYVDDAIAVLDATGVDRAVVCVVTVGGSAVGTDLLRRTAAAFPAARRLVPGLRMIVVAGPRIDPGLLGSIPAHHGLEVRGYVHDLYRHLAACDLAVVQGGLTTTMELTAGQRPFIYVPLRHHFEQNFHVRHRLGQYGAGRFLDYEQTGPDALAAAMAEEISRPVRYRPVETDGAARAAACLAELI